MIYDYEMYDRETKQGTIVFGRMRYEYWKSNIAGRWFWHIRDASNGKITDTGGEPYATKFTVRRAIKARIKRAYEASAKVIL